MVLQDLDGVILVTYGVLAVSWLSYVRYDSFASFQIMMFLVCVISLKENLIDINE